MRIYISLLFCFIGLGFMGKTSAQIPAVNLILYLPFNGNTNDESGNFIEVKNYGATLTTDRLGNKNSAYFFDGVDDYMLINNNELLNPDNFSICLWYKTISFEGVGNNAIIDKGYSSHSYPFYQYHIGVTGDLYTYNVTRMFGVDFTANNTRYTLSDTNYRWDIGKWYFLCATYDGQIARFFINNSLVSEEYIAGKLDNFGRDLLIAKFVNRDDFTPGTIDDIRIYNCALKRTEIDLIYKELGETEEDSTSNFLDLMLYPNPANSVVNFKTNLKELSQIKIFDTSGKEVYKGPFVSSLNIRFLTTGLYLFRISNSTESIVFEKKVIIRLNRLRWIH